MKPPESTPHPAAPGAPPPAPAVGRDARGATPRDRYRDQVRDEVKAAALTQLAAGGPAAVSVNAIAKTLGVSGPALYRYFKNRDDLLTELVADAYEDLAAAIRPATTPGGIATAYRAWAIAEPHRYRLLFQAPVSGFDAHSGRLVETADHAMSSFLTALQGNAPTLHPAAALAADLRRWVARRDPDATASTALHAVSLWAILHGHASLELGGNYASMGLDGAALLAAAVERQLAG